MISYNRFRWSSATSSSVNAIFAAIAAAKASGTEPAAIRRRMFTYAPAYILAKYVDCHRDILPVVATGEPTVEIDVSAIHASPKVLAVGFWWGSQIADTLAGPTAVDTQQFITYGEPWVTTAAVRPGLTNNESWGERVLFTPHLGETILDERLGEQCVVSTRYFSGTAFDKVGFFCPNKVGKAALVVISEGNL